MSIDSAGRAVTPGEAVASIGRWAGYVCVLLGMAWLAWPWSLAAAAALALLAAGTFVWSRRRPVSFGRAYGHVRGWIWRRAILRDWERVCRRCGLAEVEVPGVRRSGVAFPHVELRVRPALG